jgi:hypothetical protein
VERQTDGWGPPPPVVTRVGCNATPNKRRHATPAAEGDDVTFEEVVQSASTSDFHVDSYGRRAVLFEPPRHARVPSASSMLFGR